MGTAVATEITSQSVTLLADIAAVGAPLAGVILTAAMAGIVLHFLRRNAK